MMKGVHYTQSEIAYIWARWADVTAPVIARELNRTVGGIRNAIQRHGIKRTAKQKSRIYRGWSRKKKDQTACTLAN